MAYKSKIQFKHFAILWLSGMGHFISGHSHLHKDCTYSISASLEDFQLSEIKTNFVLLPDSGGRAKRETNITAALVPAAKAEANNQTEGKTFLLEQNGSPKGAVSIADPTLTETVDKTEQEINHMTKSHENEFSFENDTYKYYIHEFQKDGSPYFADLDHQNVTGRHAGQVKEHSMLSQSYRRAATISLSFKFPFYGHLVENITIATGGFLYTGDYVHSWLAATQYIAPLMANFDTSNNHEAKIRYLDDGGKLIVEWKDVYLQERENEGPFTFQVTLKMNGDIWFAYHTIPVEIMSIKDEEHPVKVGLSDAYIIDRTVYFARRKTIYEYHRLNMKNQEIKNKTAIIFNALQTCNTNTDCGSCLAVQQAGEEAGRAALHCRWCAPLARCSDGTDRNRQDWLKQKCDSHNISLAGHCPRPGQGSQSYNNLHQEDTHSISSHQDKLQSTFTDSSPDLETKSGVSPGGLVGSVFLCLLLVTAGGWLGYAYFNPNSASGRFLIKYRPGAWRWRQNGARYTAASIHM